MPDRPTHAGLKEGGALPHDFTYGPERLCHVMDRGRVLETVAHVEIHITGAVLTEPSSERNP